MGHIILQFLNIIWIMNILLSFVDGTYQITPTNSGILIYTLTINILFINA